MSLHNLSPIGQVFEFQRADVLSSGKLIKKDKLKVATSRCFIALLDSRARLAHTAGSAELQNLAADNLMVFYYWGVLCFFVFLVKRITAKWDLLIALKSKHLMSNLYILN